MRDNTPDLIAQRDAALALCDAILARNNTALEGDELAAFDAAEAKARDLNTRIEARARVAELAKNPANVAPGGPVGPEPLQNVAPAYAPHRSPWDESTVLREPLERMARTEVRARALAAAADRSLAATDKTRQAMTTILERHDPRSEIARVILASTSPAYLRAFAEYVNHPEPTFSAEEVEALRTVRAMSLVSSGVLVPANLDPNIVITGAGILSDIAQIARTEFVAAGQDATFVVASQISASWDAEAAEVSDDSPDPDPKTITLHKTALFAGWSIELETGVQGDLALSVAGLFADAQSRLEGTAFAVGTGSGQPYGIVTAVAAVTGSRVAATTNNAFGLVDIFALYDAVPVRHVERASWLCHPKVENLIRQFDTAGSAALWATLAEPAPAKLLGRPIFNSSAMDGTIGTGNDDILVMADMRAYVIVRRVPGMVIERVQHLFSTSNNRPTGQRGLYGWSRLGADLVDPDAARVLRV